MYSAQLWGVPVEPWVRLTYLSTAFTLIAVHDREEAPHRNHTFGQSLDKLIDVHDRSKVPHHRCTFGHLFDTLIDVQDLSLIHI